MIRNIKLAKRSTTDIFQYDFQMHIMKIKASFTYDETANIIFIVL